MGKVHVTHVEDIDPIKIDRVKNIDPLRIDRVQNIAPIAHHVKEVNHIDPITVDSFHVSQIRNIDPIKVDKFQITNLPPVNMSLQQLPPVDMNIRNIPPVSVGTYQNFHMPSNYTISGQILGFELFRVFIKGDTEMIPNDRYRKEQESVRNRSFPVAASGGNPAIPSICKEKHSVSQMSHNPNKGHLKVKL